MARIEDARTMWHMPRSARATQTTLHFVRDREEAVFGKPNSKPERAKRREERRRNRLEDLEYDILGEETEGTVIFEDSNPVSSRVA